MSCYIAAGKKGTSEISFKSSIGPSYPILKIVTSHVFAGLKRLAFNYKMVATW